jgi:hypothetical protein
MRLQTLELIRYGRFTDEKLVFPHSDCDFHLVVGPNEAGKSTIRRAVVELLFGMPLRSDMDFRHPLAELRLGAVVESPGSSASAALAFHRARGRKPLRRPDDSVLAEAALAEHLGGATAGLFERMFCLDLAGLLKGGQTILDASDDVGQLLFQSAAGLSSLGALRDALAAEADSLYAPRKSGSRAFYAALDPYEAARQALRGATVNTRAWSASAASRRGWRSCMTCRCSWPGWRRRRCSHPRPRSAWPMARWRWPRRPPAWSCCARPGRRCRRSAPR